MQKSQRLRVKGTQWNGSPLQLLLLSNILEPARRRWRLALPRPERGRSWLWRLWK